MKRTFLILTLTVSLVWLTGCHNKNKSKLVGIWQLQLLQVHGTSIRGNALGNWLMEFNESGGFLTDIAGMREKGIYELKGNTLTLRHVTKGHPDQTYMIQTLDSAELYLVAIDSVNQSTMKFIRRKVEEVAGQDKD